MYFVAISGGFINLTFYNSTEKAGLILHRSRKNFERKIEDLT